MTDGNAASGPQKKETKVGNQALVKVEQAMSRPLATVEDLTRTLEELEGTANVLSPVAAVNHVKPLHQVSIRVVKIDPQTECYQDKRFCGPNERALGGVALQKLMAAAGVQIVSKTRLDDRTDPYVCEMEIVAAMQDFDGTWRQMIGTKALDLRDGSEEAKAMLPKELANQRKQIVSMAETKAMYRACRKLFSIKQKYSDMELAKPWVVPKLVAHLDLNDPEQKAAAIQDALGSTRALFGPPRGEVRTMRDAGGARALPPAEPSNGGDAVVEQPPTREKTAPEQPAAEDFDLPDFSKDEPAPILCGCPCGDQVEVSEEVAKITQEKVGGVRCAACYPGPRFDYGKHKDLRSLGLPKMPNLTAEDVRRAIEKKDEAPKAAGGRR